MELNKLLELYLNLRKERGCLGFNSKEGAILDYVENEVYLHVAPQNVCASSITGGIPSATYLKR